MKMKKLIFTMLGFIMTLSVFASDLDSTVTTTPVTVTPPVSKLTLGGSVDSRKIVNGVGFSSSAAVSGNLTYNFCDWASLSTSGVAINSANESIGSSLENAFTVKNKNKHFALGVSDLFYFVGETHSSNNYFDYGSNTRHLVNASLKYTNNDFFAVVRGNIYNAEGDESNGVFIGAGVKILPNLELSTGYVTDASTTDFRTESGLTHIGLTGSKEVHLFTDVPSTLSVGVSFNPTDNVVEMNGLSQRPVQFGVGLTF